MIPAPGLRRGPNVHSLMVDLQKLEKTGWVVSVLEKPELQKYRVWPSYIPTPSHSYPLSKQ